MLGWITKNGKLQGYKVSRAAFCYDKLPEIEISCNLKEDISCGENISCGGLEYKVDCATGDEEKKQILASLNLDYLKSRIIDLRQYKTFTFSELIDKLPEIEFDTSEIDSRILGMQQKTDLKVCTSYDLLKRILQTKNLGFSFINNKKIKIADFNKISGKPKILAHKNSNLISLETRVENYEDYNVVKVYGKNIETTKKIEGAYPPKIKVINDERFSDQNAIELYAEALLADLSQPYFEINTKIADLDENIKLLDTVQVIDERLNNINYVDSNGNLQKVGGRKALARVTSIEIEDGIANLTLQNKRQNLADIFADYQEEQQELKSEQENFARETAQNFDNFNTNLETAKTDFSNSIAAAKANFSKEIEDAKHIFKEELIRTNKEFVSKYEEIDRTIQNVRSDYRSEIRQTAREISLQVDRVEERTSDNAREIRENSSRIDVQADRISSVVSEVREVDGRVDGVRSEMQQTANSFTWRFNDFDRRLNYCEVEINQYMVRIENGSLNVSGSVSCGSINTGTILGTDGSISDFVASSIRTGWISASSGQIGWWNSDSGQ